MLVYLLGFTLARRQGVFAKLNAIFSPTFMECKYGTRLILLEVKLVRLEMRQTYPRTYGRILAAPRAGKSLSTRENGP